MPKLIKRLLNWARDLSSCYCQGYMTESNSDHPSEFDCGAGGEIDCSQCLCNGGMYNPDTGKKDYIRYFLIEFNRWLKKLFRKCRNCKHSYCELDVIPDWNVIPDWRCRVLRKLSKDTMIEPNGYCEYWEAE